MQVLKYLQLPFHFDSPRLQKEVIHLANTNWQMHYQVKHYEGEWSAISLRSSGGKAENIIISPTDDIPYADTMYLSECPYIKTVLQSFHCPLQAVRLLKLNAGAIIKEHRDAALNFENGEIRLHIPVMTHDEVKFYLDNESMHLKEGECWYMNFNLPHHISNNSKVNRIHLVIDAVVNDWVKELFSSPDVKVKKEIEDVTGMFSTETKIQMIRQFREMNTPVSNQMADDLEKELSQPS